MCEQSTCEDNTQTIRPYYRTLSSMYNVSDQNKTKVYLTSDTIHSMKMKLNSSAGRHHTFFSMGKKGKFCSYSSCKQPDNNQRASLFPLETTGADTIATNIAGKNQFPPFRIIFFDSCHFSGTHLLQLTTVIKHSPDRHSENTAAQVLLLLPRSTMRQ